LFRSAAVSHGNRVIGIILTGYLNDGTSGMNAIKRSGGTCIVQDPNQAEYPDMPLSVLESMEVDYCVPLNEIGETIKEITKKAEERIVVIQDDVLWEAEISEKVVTRIDAVAQIGETTNYACPDCGGGLWHIKNDKNTRYRCHIGHSYTEKDLVLKQSQTIEATLWVALRMMEERRLLLNKLSDKETNKGLSKLGLSHNQRALELEGHIEKLKELLVYLLDRTFRYLPNVYYLFSPRIFKHCIRLL
jgi:two-component system chemotaxis response regulator CheB